MTTTKNSITTPLQSHSTGTSNVSNSTTEKGVNVYTKPLLSKIEVGLGINGKMQNGAFENTSGATSTGMVTVYGPS